MQSRIILVSEDSDFYDYISSKLITRKSDELFRFRFDELPEKAHLLVGGLIIINSENAEGKTLEILSILNESPAIVFAYNEDEKFKADIIQNGAIALLTPLTSDKEFKAYISKALDVASIYTKNKQYREILVRKNLIHKNNEVLFDYCDILDKELENLRNTSSSAVLVAISPDDKSKFLLQANQIETIILNNIRKNDILMSYAINKYFLLLFDSDIDNAQKIWNKISSQIPEKIYAGFAKTFSKTRQQLVNEALSHLHESINYKKNQENYSTESLNPIGTNFKLFKQEFFKKVENVINPTFYMIKQKYSDKLFGITIEEEMTDSFSSFLLKGRYAAAELKITYPGYSAINIDVIYYTDQNSVDTKRISLKPQEFENGLLEDLLEQFIEEFKKEINNGNTQSK